MALRRLSKPIIFAAFLLFSQVFARELEETPAADKKDAAKDLPYYHGPCKNQICGSRCCSEAEFAVFSQTHMDEFNDNKQGYGYGGPGYGYGGPGYGYGRPGYGYGRGGYGYGYPRRPPCYYRCGYRCCSAEEYAEFVQGGN